MDSPFSSDNPQAGSLHCIGCRSILSPPSTNGTAPKKSEDPSALRCSRCKVVHYCSRDCQAANFFLHKQRCETIHTLRSTSKTTTETTETTIADSDNDKNRRYELAYTIADLAYTSMNTIDRGRHLYHLALVEYYKLLTLDFYWNGALESVLLLLSILGYDDHCHALIDFVLTRLEDHPAERIHDNAHEKGSTAGGHQQEDDRRLLEWAYGAAPHDRRCRFEGRLGVLKDQQWCENAFLVPHLMVTLRKCDSTPWTDDDDSEYFVEHGAELGRRIERNCADPGLPVLHAFSNDSRQKWGRKEACILFAAHPSTGVPETVDDSKQQHGLPNPDPWETSCLLFWNILRDVIEDTDLGAALEDIIGAMDTFLKHPAVPEEPKRVSSWMDLLSSDNPQSGTLYCIQCRQHLSPPSSILRCSRCKVVHYCSRDCQKANFGLHKNRCQTIHNLRSMPSPLSSSSSSSPLSSPSLSQEAKQDDPPAATSEISIADNDKNRRYELAYSIVELAYLSTDTIDRGRQIYHLALVEYYKLLQLDFYWIGALESVLLLLSILGYDDHCLGLVDFVFFQLEQHPTERITIYNNGNDDDRLLEWAQGNSPSDWKRLIADLTRINILKEQSWGANVFLVPLLLCYMRKQTSERKEGQLSVALKISADLGKTVECCANSMLPVLRALFPDSPQRWGQDEACELFAPPDTRIPSTLEDLNEHGIRDPDHWEAGCLLFWNILRDTYAYTPRLLDALEDTISAMDRFLLHSAISEAPMDIAGMTAWTDAAAEADGAVLLEQQHMGGFQPAKAKRVSDLLLRSY